LKPFQSKQRGQRERDFYECVFVSEKDSPQFVALRELLPGYYGTVEVTEGGGLHPGSKKHWPVLSS
jgi:hypothetical protein